MKKFGFVLLGLVLVSGLAVTGCGGDDGGGGGGGNGTKVKALEVTFAENWSGIDLLDSYFHFATDDTLTVKGKVTAVSGASPEFVCNYKPGDWGVVKQITGIAAGTTIDFSQALDAAMAEGISGGGTNGSPDGIRIAGNNVTDNTLKIVFEQIKVTRDTTVLLDLATHLQTFNVNDSNMGLILPGSMGFQGAGTITVKIIEQ